MAQIRESLAAYRAAGIELGLPYYLAQLAQGYRQAVPADEALGVPADALATAHRAGERWCEAELYRLQGEFFLRQPYPRQQRAEACFHRALAIARDQQAKSWELRAAMSLGRLWQRQGRHDAARQALAAVYDRFTEGFGSVDLQEARALLGELSCDKPSHP